MLCLGTIAIAIVTLIGWTEHIDALKTVLPGLTTMKANAAIGVATAALGLLPSSGSWGRAVQHLAMILAGGVVVALAVLTLWEYAFGVRLGLDELFFRDPDTTSMPFPGRMSPATALALLATGAAMILLAAERRGRPVIMAHVLAALPAAIGYLSLADYAYGVEGLYGFRPFVPIAINTATALVFLAFAILTTHADESWAREYRRLPLSRGVLSRLLVLSLTVPFVSGLFVVLGAKLGFYKPLFGPVLFACVSALAIVWLALHAAATVRRAEGEIHLSHALGGNVLLGLNSAIGFATILAVVAGLTLAAASAISHDLYASVIKRGGASEADEVRVAKFATLGIGGVAIALGIAFERQNIAYMVGLAYSISASSNFPVLILALYWPGLTTRGAVAGGWVGLVGALLLTILGPPVWVKVLGYAAPLFSLDPPTLVTLPLTFATCLIVSLTDRSRQADADRAGYARQRALMRCEPGADQDLPTTTSREPILTGRST